MYERVSSNLARQTKRKKFERINTIKLIGKGIMILMFVGIRVK